MDEMISQLITTAMGLGLMGFGYLIWFLTGVVNATFNTKTWSWHKTFVDIAKALIMSVVLLSIVVLANGIEWYTSSLGFDVSEIMNPISITVITGALALGCTNYYGKAVINAARFFKLKLGELRTPEQVDYAAVADPTKQVISDIIATFYTPKELAEAHKQFEQEGGRGAYYALDISSYDRLRVQVLGKGYDIDGNYGYQCWDGAGLLWQQKGRTLQTGDGSARGCWAIKRSINAGQEFDLITSAKDIRRGDVVVFKAGEYGHIGFADQDYSNPNYIPLLGQNQDGTPKHPKGGAGFNVVNVSLNSFIGAFRLKEWSTSNQAVRQSATASVQPVATTQVTEIDHTQSQQNANINKGDYVKVTKFIDVDGAPLRQDMGEKFLVYQASKTTKTAVLKSADGDIYARMSFNNIEKVS